MGLQNPDPQFKSGWYLQKRRFDFISKRRFFCAVNQSKIVGVKEEGLTPKDEVCMREDIKDLLKRYDEIGALILEQKLDEFGDKLDQKPEGVDDTTYEEYIQRLAKDETDEATDKLENEPDETSWRQVNEAGHR